MSIVIDGLAAIPSHNIASIDIDPRSRFEGDAPLRARWIVTINVKTYASGCQVFRQSFFFKSSAQRFAAKAMRDEVAKALDGVAVSILLLTLSILLSAVYLVKGVSYDDSNTQ